MKNYNVIELDNNDNIAYLNRNGDKIVTTWGQYTTNIRNVVDAYLEVKEEVELLRTKVIAQDAQAELEALKAEVAELKRRAERDRVQVREMEREKIANRKSIRELKDTVYKYQGEIHAEQKRVATLNKQNDKLREALSNGYSVSVSIKELV